jgi:hypothetical protein
MSGSIFNNPRDDYIFTGSRFRAGTTVDKLKLSKGENTYIDICENYIDISAINVFINNKKVLTESPTFTVENISAGTIDASINLNVKGVTRLGGNLYVQGDVSINGPNMYVPAEFTIDPALFDDKAGKVIIKGDLEVQGTTTTINSTRVDISDLSITLASNARNTSDAQGAGFDISGTGGASFTYDNLTGTARFKSTIGLGISGNLLPFNRTSQVPVSSNTYMLKRTGFSSYVTTASNEWIVLHGYDISKVVLSTYSYIKMEFKVNFYSSPEAEQYLGLRVQKNININNINDNLSWTTVFTDPSLGSIMGVGLNSVYNGTYIDDLSGADIYNNIVTYRLLQWRNKPSYDNTISEFGVIGGGDVGNYIFLQELYRPAAS